MKHQQSSKVLASFFESLPRGKESWLDHDSAASLVQAAKFLSLTSVPVYSEVLNWYAGQLESIPTPSIVSVAHSLSMMKAYDAGSPEQRIIACALMRIPSEVGTMDVPMLSNAMTLLTRNKVSDSGLWHSISERVRARSMDITEPGLGVRVLGSLAKMVPQHAVVKDLIATLEPTIPELRSSYLCQFSMVIEKLKRGTPKILQAIASRAASSIKYYQVAEISTLLRSCAKMYFALERTEKQSDLAEAYFALAALFTVATGSLVRRDRLVDVTLFADDLCHELVHILNAYQSTDNVDKRLFRIVESALVSRSNELGSFEIAMILGILSRAEMISATLLTSLSGAIEANISKFTTDEVSYVANTYSACGVTNNVNLGQLKARLLRELSEHGLSAPARMNGAMAFGAPYTAEVKDFKVVAHRFLIESYVRQAPSDADFQARVRKEIVSRVPEMLPRDLARIFKKGGNLDEVKSAAMQRITTLANEDSWGPHVLHLLPLARKLDNSPYLQKALATARQEAITSSQFVKVTRTLLKLFPKEIQVFDFVQKGMAELVEFAPLHVVAEFAEIIAKHQEVSLGPANLDVLTKRVVAKWAARPFTHSEVSWILSLYVDPSTKKSSVPLPVAEILGKGFEACTEPASKEEVESLANKLKVACPEFKGFQNVSSKVRPAKESTKPADSPTGDERASGTKTQGTPAKPAAQDATKPAAQQGKAQDEPVTEKKPTKRHASPTKPHPKQSKPSKSTTAPPKSAVKAEPKKVAKKIK